MKFFFFSVLLLGTAAACGGGGNCGEGSDGVPDIIEDDEDLNTFVVGRLGVGELDQITGTDPGHSSLVQAFFNDFTNYQVELADRVIFSEACMVYTSQQVATGEIEYLAVDRVVIGGLAGGELVMQPEGTPPKISPQIMDGRAFTPEPVTFSVESAGGAGEFPALSVELQPPAPMVITRLGEVENPDLSQGHSVGINTERVDPLVVQWEAGGGSYVEIKLVPGRNSQTQWAKLRCITFDDGCLHIPAEALAFMVADTASDFQFKAERHNFVLHSVRDGDTVKAAAVVDVSSAVEATVLR